MATNPRFSLQFEPTQDQRFQSGVGRYTLVDGKRVLLSLVGTPEHHQIKGLLVICDLLNELEAKANGN